MTTDGPVGARIVHKLTCHRCRMGWGCGGIGIEDIERASVIAPLLDEVRGSLREQIARDIEALPSPHANTLDHAARVARGGGRP